VEAVVLNETGEVYNIDVTDAPRELIQRANLMKSEISTIIKEVLAIEYEEAEAFWSASEAQRIAEASQIIAERNGDPVDD
jgi:post-segregation antitoxin (ccd killing protein)